MKHSLGSSTLQNQGTKIKKGDGYSSDSRQIVDERSGVFLPAGGMAQEDLVQE
jgi:hypothetical protein